MQLFFILFFTNLNILESYIFNNKKRSFKYMLIRRGLFFYDGKSLNKKYISILLFISLFVVIFLVLPRIILLYSIHPEKRKSLIL